MAEFKMLVGLPGSGKSTFARTHGKDYIIHSSDLLREEMLGDINDQSNNDRIFAELHRRIKEDLKVGKNVIYDATNIRCKRRIAFLNELKGIDCKKTATVFVTPYERCLRNNWSRERKIPDEAILKMYVSWQTPYYFEGWDNIELIKHTDCYKSYASYVIEWYSYNQNSLYHKNSLGEHMILCGKYVMSKSDESNLIEAAMFHDCGKPFCKTDDDNGISHYYNHENVGAYDALSLHGLPLETSAYINYHMYPMSWYTAKDPENVKNKYKKLWGDRFFNNIMLLHDADTKSS